MFISICTCLQCDEIAVNNKKKSLKNSSMLDSVSSHPFTKINTLCRKNKIALKSYAVSNRCLKGPLRLNYELP